MPDPSPRSVSRHLGTVALVVLVVVLVAAGFLWQRDGGEPPGGAVTEFPTATPAGTSTPAEPSGPAEDPADGPADDTADDTADAAPGETATGGPGAGAAPAALPRRPRVVVVSIDGLASYAVTEQGTPTLHRLLEEGAGTLNARTAYEQTHTLPNHTGMVTGRRVDPAEGGHGVTWNEESRRTVRPGVQSVFSVIARAGGDSAVFAGKPKFEMWERAWPGTIDELVIDDDLPALTGALLDDLAEERRELTFFHVAAPDSAGHEHAWGSPQYDAAVVEADAALARVVDAVEADPRLARETLVVVTADHGGARGEFEHGDPASRADHQVPFVVWGRGVAAADLYALNPDYADPGTGRPSYDGPQPVRNAAVANLVLDLLRLRPVPGSQVGTRHDLDVR
ncbi:alkaline phosphatase family protein [Nocardioides sp. SYSU DS0651]|uniref:alkaline phosphatase family protein n=1 Tax=Nocardioides sp. SYSU DS0651 TaxID=3415955 RepID=UPI003F4BD547